MIDTLWAMLALIGGAVAGGVFFGGLWWTVKRGADPTSSIMLWVASLAVRSAVVVGTFSVLSANRFERMLLCLAGFTIARIVIVQIVKRQLRTTTTTATTATTTATVAATVAATGCDACA